MTGIDSIETLGYPLGFKIAAGADRPEILRGVAGRNVIRVEARQMAGHQKEAVVTEGLDGCSWRLTTDEDGHLRGTDLAPFPLGFYNAGLHGDLINRFLTLARLRSIPIHDLALALNTGYYMTGSFFKGTGEGIAEPAAIDLAVDSPKSDEVLKQLLMDAVVASPGMASMRIPVSNTFALYVNGRRNEVTTMTPSPSDDAPDPFRTYSAAPAPNASDPGLDDLIRKTGEQTDGESVVAPGDMKTKQIRPVIGTSRLLDPDGVAEIDVVLGMPGASHFALKSDEGRAGAAAPSGLSLLSAGIAFCYMTQLSRYIEYQKMSIRGVRLVQDIPFFVNDDGDRMIGGLEPADTHLFLSGDEDAETFERLMRIAERTCYLHNTLSNSLHPKVTLRRIPKDSHA